MSLRHPMIKSAQRTIGVIPARGAYTQVLGIKLGDREQGTGNREQKTGNREQETGNRKQERSLPMTTDQ
ncbi:MAG: hypothetical protein HEQ26_00740 [Dolichospermum sp. DL01]|nr:MAG: hypothetical protein HEQ26_00740 [Dolichospermum sp. DL01]